MSKHKCKEIGEAHREFTVEATAPIRDCDDTRDIERRLREAAAERLVEEGP